MSWMSTTASRGLGQHGSSYSSTSYGGSTSYMSRNTAGRDSGIGGYSSHKGYGSRPLPTGPGPLDSAGKKLSNYSVTSHLDSTTTRRNRTPSSTRTTGPLKANHALSYNKVPANDYSRHTSTTTATHYSSFGSRRSSITNNPITGTGYGEINGTTATTAGGRSRPLSGTSGTRTPNKSTSLTDLSSLSLTDNRYPYKGGGGVNSTTTTATNSYNKDRSSVLLHHHHPSSSSNGLVGSSTTNGGSNGLNSNANLAATASRNINGHSHYRDHNNNDDDLFRSSKPPRFDDARPDGTLRTGYTPSMSRETSPINNNVTTTPAAGHGRRVSGVDSPPKSSLSNQSSNSSMSNGSYTGYSSSSGSYSTSSSYMSVSSKHRDGGKVGLRNLGNTCFMNSVLQCLSNTRILLEYCLDENYQRDINTTTSNMRGSLIRAYGSMMNALWKERADSSVSPTAFKTQIQKFAPRFMGYSQQDSQEFLRYLLEGLHEDVNRVTKKPAPIILDDDELEKKSDSDKALDYWKAYINRDNSQIVDIFVGQLKSELKFTSCSHRSVTFDPFWDLSLPIPKNRSEISIEDCIRLFMKEEELASEERPNCAKCKQRRACLKMFSIHKFPKILVLHLKRFSQERYGRKLTTLVDFPIRGLDLSEYSAASAQGSGVGSRRVLYDLYAVSNHSGGTSSGHYTAYCKNPYTSEWLFFNDSRVSPARSNEAISSEAYVLFYELSGQSSKM